MEGEVIDKTIEAICSEINNSAWKGMSASTIFFGGGTPTFLSEKQLIRVFEAVLSAHPPESSAEITSEANPGTVDMPKFAAMRRAGFNRISMGAQSFVDNDLIRLGRVHRAGDIERAVGAAREAGFSNMNLDLMFGLPGQNRRAWLSNMERAIALQPEHLSLYCLTIEQNTPFYKEHSRGELVLPEDEELVTMYEDCGARLQKAGYLQYEISNYTQPGLECRHNLAYWNGDDYAGYGPGAVGCMDGVRYTNLKHPELYMKALSDGRPLFFESEKLTEETRRVERIMLGLRLNSGIPRKGLEVSPIAFKKLVAKGWLEDDAEVLQLTKQGRHFCSEVALELI